MTNTLIHRVDYTWMLGCRDSFVQQNTNTQQIAKKVAKKGIEDFDIFLADLGRKINKIIKDPICIWIGKLNELRGGTV